MIATLAPFISAKLGNGSWARFVNDRCAGPIMIAIRGPSRFESNISEMSDVWTMGSGGAVAANITPTPNDAITNKKQR